jgi:hypothetical protein
VIEISGKPPAMALLTTRSRGSRSRMRTRQLSPVELAVGFALVGSVVAVAVPTFVREVHASRFVEPVEGLQRIGAAAIAYGRAHPVAQAFPPSAPLTPSVPPRGHCEADPPGLWDQATWTTLGFRPSPEGVPHCYAFRFESTASPASSASPARAAFRAEAHGDLDGDGIDSTFEVTGHDVEGDPQGPTLDRGVYVESEVE